jgi:hypothetical protein
LAVYVGFGRAAGRRSPFVTVTCLPPNWCAKEGWSPQTLGSNAAAREGNQERYRTFGIYVPGSVAPNNSDYPLSPVEEPRCPNTPLRLFRV